MKMKRLLAVALGAMLSLSCGAMAACGGNEDKTDQETPSGGIPSEGTPSEGTPSEGTHYNIIFTLATIPPVLAALDSIENGYPTYAMIERGNTYSGIEKTEGLDFHNIGFDTASNTSAGFSEEKIRPDCGADQDALRPGERGIPYLSPRRRPHVRLRPRRQCGPQREPI